MGGLPQPAAAKALAERDDFHAYCFRTAERSADWLATRDPAIRPWSRMNEIEREAMAWDVAKHIGALHAMSAEPIPEAPR